MSWYRSRRGLLALLGLVLIILFMTRPGVGRLRTKIAKSISSALGRQVEISDATLRFLPQPGFDLENFVVYDDPAFSPEPVLRSSEVTASLRLTSLLRGRLEIARLSLTDPSLNLVRNDTGYWNLEYLISRNAQIPAAPTAKPTSERRPAFPYIEASGARINFKFGMEKKQFALTDADFSLFQDSENSWGVRLEARPVRTDANFSDSGVLKVSGTWQRASSLHDTPLRISLQWQQAQLGQVTKLIYGTDKGWRGAAAVSAEISGTPANLAIITVASVEDFRRYDIIAGTPMRLRAQCGGNYSSMTQSLSNIICQSPVGDGALTLHGNITASNPATFHLAAFAQDVPLQSAIALARHAKKDIPNDVRAAGTINGSVKIQREGGIATEYAGEGETSECLLGSAGAGPPLSLPKIQFSISRSGAEEVKKSRRGVKVADQISGDTRVNFSPFVMALGGTKPATVQGWFSRTAYGVTIGGEARLRRLLRTAQTVGIPSPQPDADGDVKFDLLFADSWSGFKPPRASGIAELHAVEARVNGLSEPLVIDSAKMILGPDQINVQSIAASLGGGAWHGSLTLPRSCVAAACEIEADFHADEISTAALGEIFNSRKAPWYRFLGSGQKSTPTLLALRARGRISADRVLLSQVAATHFTSNFDLDHGTLLLTNMHSAVLGGIHSGDWKLDFKARPPTYSGEGSLQHFALAQLANAMHDNWIGGTASATYRATASGANIKELFSSATGSFKLEAHDGFLPHILPATFTAPLQLRHFEGNLVFRRGAIDFEQSKLSTNDGVYEVTGTASMGREINLKLLRSGSRGFNIGGTIAAPLVSITPIPETQAALKP